MDPFTEVDEQLAKERAEELAKTREKEQNLNAKKKQVDSAGLKAYSKGVGKFINPNLKKKAQKIDDEDLATPVVKKKKQIKNSMNDFSGWGNRYVFFQLPTCKIKLFFLFGLT